ncbi:effector-associated constant component EACC1 [Streptomyces werraensis]|uniref:effector-associated constant component EACC1 n=1 Tax=Streptomyces werraensis TaxID=68284 RepID=UPI0033A5DE8B
MRRSAPRRIAAHVSKWLRRVNRQWDHRLREKRATLSVGAGAAKGDGLVNVRIAVTGNDTAGESLLEWLRQEPGLRGRVRHIALPPQPGTMGSLSELVVEGVVTGTIGTLAGLLGQSLSVWLSQRLVSGDHHTAVEITTAEGRSVRVTAQGAAEAEQLIRLALADQTHVGPSTSVEGSQDG